MTCAIGDRVSGTGFNGLHHQGIVQEVNDTCVFLEKDLQRGCRILLAAETVVKLEPLEPFLKYAGGKRKLVSAIAHYWQPYCDRRFVELFVGSAAVALGLRPQEALLNDLNPHLINLHLWVQRGLEITLPMKNDKEYYLAQRTNFNQLIKVNQAWSTAAAQLLYYLNHNDYNGLMRFNGSGFFNAPFGKYKTVNYIKDFSPWQQAFQRWEFTAGEFANVKLQPSDFVYADPPYDQVTASEDGAEQMVLLDEGQENGRGFTTYSGDRFTWIDQLNLAKQLAAHPGPALISNAATPRIVELYERLGFQIQFVSEARHINCNGSDRKPANCLLAWKKPVHTTP